MRDRYGAHFLWLVRWVATGLLLLITGCSDPSALVLDRWTFVRGAVQTEITLPAKVDERMGPRGGTYELRKVVVLPLAMRGVPLTLTFVRLPALVALQVDGHEVETGIPQHLVDYRSPHAQRFRIPGELTQAPSIALRLIVRDTWFQSTWIDSTPRLSTHIDGDRWFRFAATFNTATAAAAIVFALSLGFSYLLVFLADRRREAYGWVAAQGLSAASYPLLTLGVTQVLVGTHDLRTLALLSVAALVSVGYTHAQFGGTMPRRFLITIGSANFIVAIVAGGPFSARYGIAPVVVASVTAAACYQLHAGTKLLALSTRRTDVILLLSSWGGMTLVAAPDLLYWVGLGGWTRGLHPGCLGIMWFAALQAVALSREHDGAMGALDDLNAQLAARIVSLEAQDKENQRLADELRRQVAARSRQLSHALSRLGRDRDVLTELVPGTIIDSRYRVLSRLGDGGMAVVYEVERCEDRRKLALKLLRSTSDASTLARFAREAQIASEISHPNLVAIHDIDFATAGFMYVVMDLVRGDSLRTCKARYGDTQWALFVLREAALGLSALHERGVVHRDLKPENVLIEENGSRTTVKISDFGIAAPLSTLARRTDMASTKLVDDVTRPIDQGSSETLRSAEAPTHIIAVAAIEGVVPGVLFDAPHLSMPPHALGGAEPGQRPSDPSVTNAPRLTEAGKVLGTPAYMAPELGDPSSEGSEPSRDVFSFGIMAYELLTNARPYLVVPIYARMEKLPIPAPRPLEVAPEFDRELRRLIEQSVALEPADRPTIRELASALERIVATASEVEIARAGSGCM